MNVRTIGIAVVESRNSFLVGVRPDDQVLAGCAEFPGGKAFPDEPSAVCAVRECHEETGLRVVPIRELCVCEHEYSHGRVCLHFWLCHPECPGGDAGSHFEAADQPAAASGFRWVRRDELFTLPFPDGNREVLNILRNIVERQTTSEGEAE